MSITFKKELVKKLKVHAPVFQFNAPLDSDIIPAIVYRLDPQLPINEGDGKYYGLELNYTVNLYVVEENEVLANAVERSITEIDKTFIRSISFGVDSEGEKVYTIEAVSYIDFV